MLACNCCVTVGHNYVVYISNLCPLALGLTFSLLEIKLKVHLANVGVIIWKGIRQ